MLLNIIIDKQKVLQYFNEHHHRDRNAEQIAATMAFLDDEGIDLTTHEKLLLACRLFEARSYSTQPCLSDEWNDALRYAITIGISCSKEIEISAEYAPDFLMQCSQEIFNYILEHETAENQIRFELECPLKPERIEEEIHIVLDKIKTTSRKT